MRENLLTMFSGSPKELSTEQAWHYRIVPIAEKDNVLSLATDSLGNKAISDELEIILGRRVQLSPMESTGLEKLLLTNYPRHSTQDSEVHPKRNSANEPTGDYLGKLILQARDLRSSDIHIETYGEKCRIRFRVDGALADRLTPTRSEYPSIINRIKIAASCDIGERRLPQDGRIRYQSNGEKIDLRVSVLPTLYGEKIVLRILGTDAQEIDIHNIGLGDDLSRYLTALKKPHGIILISGPTGSGKTTTLYATLKLLNKQSVNIVTIEDPIEYTLDGINQVQLKEDIGLTFPAALRTFLRQDPDVIMLGEIRDAETAQMAIRAAMTGHLVLSTIHTNSAWGIVSRLIDMGVPAYLVASTLNLAVAQRLLRKLCMHCRQETEIQETALPDKHFREKLKTGHTAIGCDKCHYTGYSGRKAIYEVICNDVEIAEMIRSGNTGIGTYKKALGIPGLVDQAIRCFKNGETSLEEIYPYLISSE